MTRHPRVWINVIECQNKTFVGFEKFKRKKHAVNKKTFEEEEPVTNQRIDPIEGQLLIIKIY